MGDISPERRPGCGILNAVFGRHSTKPRRSTSTGSLQNLAPRSVTRVPSTPTSRRRKNGADDIFHDSSNGRTGSPHGRTDQRHVDRIIERPGQNYVKTAPIYHKPPALRAHHPNPAKIETPKMQQAYIPARKVTQGTFGLSGELDSMILDSQRAKGGGPLYGNLGNLRQSGSPNGGTNVFDYFPKTAKETPVPNNEKYPTSVMGNVVVKKNKEASKKPDSLCRALSTRMDPEELKILGNEDYKNGRFAEALALYDAAISIDPNKAAYRSNKSAALTALGKLLEAAFECREAIRIDPYYQRAHNRLATLYVRLGEAEKAAYHFKQSGPEADPDAMNKAKKVQIHLSKCTEAKRHRDWNSVLKETELSISVGADSAPLIFALKAEALLKINKHQEAIETMAKGPNFDIEDCTKFFGPIGSAGLLVVRAQVDLVSGRFDDAMEAVQRASRLDSNNKDVNTVFRRTKAVVAARSNGNELFKTGKYSEACIAYGEGLNHDPHNAVLLCNRAACRSKLGQYEKAIEDCNAALNVRSTFSKARLRRADCYAKMEKWEACIQDCEVLIRENRDDEEVAKMLSDAKAKLGHGVEQ